jgi:hypothetical protein
MGLTGQEKMREKFLREVINLASTFLSLTFQGIMVRNLEAKVGFTSGAGFYSVDFCLGCW